ncbi:tetratricopeptide repeat protein, partial [Candidatus Bipolaricaulota bacterium]|nr:tetratricopeptide repeat protein [Candidatus Bipolaricaulota bacterium]
NLVIQLTSAKKLDLAMDVLGLNIHAYPQYADSYLRLARIYLQKGDDVSAKATLLNALSIEPDNVEAIELLKMVQ